MTTFSLSVSKGETQPTLFKQSISDRRRYSWLKMDCSSKENRVDLVLGRLYAVRTNDLFHFCEDFFLPGVIATAVFVDRAAAGIFPVLLNLILDVCTFPLRCITLIPRFIYNRFCGKESDVFYRFLKSSGAGNEILDQDKIFVKFTEKRLLQNKSSFFYTHHFCAVPAHVYDASQPGYSATTVGEIES